MVDKAIISRAKRQRELRTAEGWHELTVWVPTSEDARDVRALAAEQRARAKALEGLSREVPWVTKALERSLAESIAKRNVSAGSSPSGAVLDLLTALADAEDLRGFSRAVAIVTRAKPADAAALVSVVPDKVSDFLVTHCGVSVRDLMSWTDANPSWGEDLKAAVRDPEMFERVVEAMADAVSASSGAPEDHLQAR